MSNIVKSKKSIIIYLNSFYDSQLWTKLMARYQQKWEAEANVADAWCICYSIGVLYYNRSRDGCVNGMHATIMHGHFVLKYSNSFYNY